MNIQRLGPAHAAEYRAIMLEAYELHPDAFTSSLAERAALPRLWWAARLDSTIPPAQLVLGAMHEGRIAGVAGVSFESREKARHKATLFGMYVPARYRRLGLGHRLVRAVLEEAKSHPPVRLVQLSVTHGNLAAQALYEQCGFVEFGLEPFAVAVGDGFVAKVHMWCDLGIVEGEA